MKPTNKELRKQTSRSLNTSGDKPLKCLNCKGRIKCNCFDIDLDEYIAPFCSEECVNDYDKKNDTDFGDSVDGHIWNCENQFNVRDNKVKELIKEVQYRQNLFERVYFEQFELRKQAELKGRAEAIREIMKIMPTNWLDMPNWVLEKLEFKPIDIERLFEHFYKKIKELKQ